MQLVIEKSQLKAKIEEIHNWFDLQCDVSLPKHRAILKRIAEMIWQRQTHDEQDRQETKYVNGIGYGKLDVEFASNILKYPDMSEKMAKSAQKMLRKYARQVAEIRLGMP